MLIDIYLVTILYMISNLQIMLFSPAWYHLTQKTPFFPLMQTTKK